MTETTTPSEQRPCDSVALLPATVVADERRLLLSVMRIFLGVQVLSLSFAALAFMEHDSPLHATDAVWGMLALTASLLVGTALPFSRHDIFLRVSLGALLLLPALGQGLALLHSVRAFQKMAIELTFLLAVPVVLIAWRSSFRWVVGLTVLVSAIDACLLAISPIAGEELELMIHLVIDRTVVLLIVGYVVSRLVREQRRQHGLLERANRQLGYHAASLEHLTVSRERNRMARELHDTLAHTLSAIAVQLEATNSAWKSVGVSSGTAPVAGADSPTFSGTEGQALGVPSANIATMLQQAHQLARSGLVDVRRALRELRASPIDDLGLVLAIRALAEQLEERTGAVVGLELPAASLDLPKDTEQGIYRIVQEALLNVERHAGAKRVRLELSVRSESITVAVDDDGCGFDGHQVPEGKYGLVGLQERGALLGGRLSIDSSPGAGTSIRLELALSSQSDKVAGSL